MLVHCYLNLVSAGATAEAQQLLAAHKQRFVAGAAGEPSKLRMQVDSCVSSSEGSGRLLGMGAG